MGVMHPQGAGAAGAGAGAGGAGASARLPRCGAVRWRAAVGGGPRTPDLGQFVQLR